MREIAKRVAAGFRGRLRHAADEIDRRQCASTVQSGGAGVALAMLLGAGALGFGESAFAQDSIYVPLFTYRTGPFSGSGIPVADGMHDYLSMLNERDGGIGGV